VTGAQEALLHQLLLALASGSTLALAHVTTKDAATIATRSVDGRVGRL